MVACLNHDMRFNVKSRKNFAEKYHPLLLLGTDSLYCHFSFRYCTLYCSTVVIGERRSEERHSRLPGNEYRNDLTCSGKQNQWPKTTGRTNT